MNEGKYVIGMVQQKMKVASERKTDGFNLGDGRMKEITQAITDYSSTFVFPSFLF